MKTAIVAALGLILLAGSESEAQVVIGAISPGSPHAPASATFGRAYVPPAATPTNVDGSFPGRLTFYSYFAVPDGLPARLYAGLGTSDQFPYYGQPYGNPYDRWSWSNMTGFPPNRLVRYYYPPVP